MTRIDMTAREWHELIKPVISHAGTDKDFPDLAVVRLELAEHAVYAVATDRYTIAAERSVPGGYDARIEQPVHISARDAAASLKLFEHSKDEDPLLRITVDSAAIPISVVGQPRSISRLAVTIQADDGTRLVLHDVRDPSRDPLAGWRKAIGTALRRPPGRALEGMDLIAWQLARWASAARKGERLTVYTGPDPGDPLLVTVEKHFAGLWVIQQYLDGPAKTLAALPWQHEIAAGIDLETGERSDSG